MKVHHTSSHSDDVQYFLDKLNRISVHIFDTENDLLVFLTSLMEMYTLGMVEASPLSDLILDADTQKSLETYQPDRHFLFEVY